MKSFVASRVPAIGVLALALVACRRDRISERDRGADRPPTLLENDRELGLAPGGGANEGERDKPGTTTVTGANVGALSNDSAIDRIVFSRCARESACNFVGNDKRFTNQDVCRQKLRSEMRDELSASECPRGIDAKELGECLAAIQNEDCSNPIDAISRLVACRTSDLCLKTDARNR